MPKSIYLPIHATVSTLFIIWFVAFTANDILSVGNSYFWLICYSCPFVIIAVLMISSLYFLRPDYSAPLKYLPLSVNVLAAIAGIALFQFADSNRDFGFQWHYTEYTEAVKLIETGQTLVYPDGFAVLPEKYKHLSSIHEAFVSKSGNTTSIYFLYDAETFDGFSWGYLYRSDGSNPSQADQCYPWRKVNPPISNWYYCEANAVFWEHR